MPAALCREQIFEEICGYAGVPTKKRLVTG